MSKRAVQTALIGALFLSAAGFLRLQTQSGGVNGLQAAEGLEATLFAGSPMLRSPTAIDVDARGRVWVTEGHNYRNVNLNRGVPAIGEGDRILILEDTNGDGKADTQKVFYQGTDINAALGIAVFGNQVIVSAYEHIFLFTDTDGDDRADTKEVIFRRNPANHDHTTHSFVFGPDGRLYFNTGNVGGPLMDPAGNVMVDRAGNRIVPDSGAYRQGMVFRVNRDFTGLETLGHNFRNPYEVALDSYGTMWQSDNDDDGHRAVRINYVMEFGNYGYRDERTGASWQTARIGLETQPQHRHWHQNDPGVVPNLLITGTGSPAGITFYEGDLLPPVFQNTMIHADAGPNVVRSYPTEVDGAGYRATMVNLLRQTADPNFRPVDVATAPDGSLFIADWYDQVIGGHDARNLTEGRILRLAPPAHQYRVSAPDLSTVTGAVRALTSPNQATRYLGHRRLIEHGAAAEPALRELWASQDPRMRARALWLLAQVPNAGPGVIDEALSDSNPDLRITGMRAARLLERDILGYAARMASDPSPQVRREVALALRYESSPRAAEIWTQLARQYDGTDRWYLEALGIAADGKWDLFLSTWRHAVGTAWKQRPGRDIVWRSRTDLSLPLLSELLLDPATPQQERERYFRALDYYQGPARERTLMAVIEGNGATDPQLTGLALLALDSASIQITPRIRSALEQTLAANRGTSRFVSVASKFNAREQSAELLHLALAKPDSTQGVEAARLAIRWNGVEAFREAAWSADLDRARNAITVLSYVGGADAQQEIEAVALSPDRPLDLRRFAVLAYGRVQGGWAGPLPEARSPAELPRNLVGDRRLLVLVRGNMIPEDLKESAAAVLFASNRFDVRTSAADYLPQPSSRTADGRVLPPIEELAIRTGDAATGRSAYARACAMCHVAQGTGIDFGPPLSEIGDKLPKAGLYSKILEPNSGIAFNYEGSVVRMRDGRELTGIVVSQTASELALKVIGGVVTRHDMADVSLVIPMDGSLMPERLETALTEQELVDLVEYLSTLRAAPR
jgi:putative membrane-bound dehydrogenase-like protein